MVRLPLSSKDFVDARPRTGLAVVLTIVIIIIVLLVFFFALALLLRTTTEPCTTPPPPPTFIQATKINDLQFRVQWEPAETATGYIVYVGIESEFPRIQSVAIVPVNGANTTEAVISGLTINETYYIVVSSTNDCGQSGNSQEISFVFT